MTFKSDQSSNLQKRLLWIGGAIVIVLLALFFVRSNQTGAVEINPPNNVPANVFVDKNSEDPLQSTSSSATYEVGNGEHEILVASDGYWPWKEDVEITDGETVELAPFLVSRSSQRVSQMPDELTQSLTEAENAPVAASSSPILSDDENIRVFVNNDTNIIAQWTQDPSSAPDYFNCHEGTCGVSVYNAETPVTQVEFYPNQDNAIIFATGVGVFAIEIDPTGSTQNFQPVARGVQNPVFTLQSNTALVQTANGITATEL